MSINNITQGVRAEHVATNENTPDQTAIESDLDGAILPKLTEQITAIITNGGTVSAADFPAESRLYFHGAMQKVRNTIPVKPGWKTVDEDFVDGLRLRQRTYRLKVSGHIDGTLLALLAFAVAVVAALAVRGAA